MSLASLSYRATTSTSASLSFTAFERRAKASARRQGCRAWHAGVRVGADEAKALTGAEGLDGVALHVEAKAAFGLAVGRDSEVAERPSGTRPRWPYGL